MRHAKSATISFLLASGLTCVELRRPRSVRPGWFELDGPPRAIEGEPVRDWAHANDLFARFAAQLCSDLERQKTRDGRWHGGGPDVERELTIEYVPTGREHATEVVVRMSLPSGALVASLHPIGLARYVIVGANPPKALR